MQRDERRYRDHRHPDCPAGGAPPAGTSPFRPGIVAAYEAAPRGRTRRGFDPERMVPRWGAALVSLFVLCAIVIAGCLIHVPLRYGGTVISAADHTVFVAITGGEQIGTSDQVTLSRGDTEVSGEVIQVKVAPDEESGYRMIAIQSDEGGMTTAFPAGERITVEAGSKPVLFDVIER